MASLAPSTPSSKSKHYLIIGGTRGIGLQFVKTLLAQGHYVLVTARHSSHFHDSKPDSGGPPLDKLVADLVAKGEEARLRVLKLDVADEKSVEGFGERVVSALGGKGTLETVVVNAGVLRWPGGVIGGSFDTFSYHLTTNAIGPLMVANALLKPALSSSSLSSEPANAPLTIHNLIFISSDSGSTTRIRTFEDGFAAYATSKAALNMGVRHLAAELARQWQSTPTSSSPPVILCLHPGEVPTEISCGAQIPWEVRDVVSVDESVSGMLGAIERFGRGGEKEFEGRETGSEVWGPEGGEGAGKGKYGSGVGAMGKEEGDGSGWVPQEKRGWARFLDWRGEAMEW